MAPQSDGQHPPLLTVQQTDEPLTLCHRDISAGCLLSLFLLAWSYATVSITAKALRSGESGALLGIVIMSLVWVIIFGLLIWSWFGREILIFTDTEVIHERRAFVRLTRNSGPLSRIQQVEILLPHERDGPKSEKYGVKVTSQDLEMELRADLARSEAVALCDRIRTWIEGHASGELDPPPEATLVAEPEVEAKPSRTKRLFSSVGTTLACVFFAVIGIVWNISVVSMLIQHGRNGNWGMLGFVMPLFVLIGLFLGLLSVVIIIEGIKIVVHGVHHLIHRRH
jgi:hypothetical protein